MPRDGSGNYSLPSGNPVVPNTIISSSGWANPTLTDIAAAITGSISKDGQTTPTGNLPMGNFRHTNVANAQSRSDYAAAGQVQDGVMQWLISVAGTDTITASLPVPLLAAYTAGQEFRFMPAGANATNTVTLNVNGIGAKSVMKTSAGGLVALAPGDIPAGVVQTVIYDGTQLVLQVPAAQQLPHGQCRMSVVSATQLKLSPYNGNSIIINGAAQQIPSAGVTLSNGGLNNATLYYVYAYMNSGVMTLEAVTTTHATGNNGVEIKSGDATRTLVGMIYTNASAQFVDGPAARQVLNWFNRRNLSASLTSSPLYTFTVGSMAEINTAIRVTFLSWSDEAASGGVSGTMANNTSNFNVRVQSFMDSAAWGIDAGEFASVNSQTSPYCSRNSLFVTEGLHIAQVYGAVSGGTGILNTVVNEFVTRG